jgi:CHAT domain-containing protein
MWMVQSRGFAAIASAQNGDFVAARALLRESQTKAAEVDADSSRAMLTAFSNLMSADLERYLGNLGSAEKQYTEAAKFYDSGSDYPFLREQTHEGLLMTYLAGDNQEKLEEQIPLNIRLAEEYRPNILDDDQRIGFFDLRGNVYDIACEFEFDKGNLEAAYNYAEASSSRSLLERMQRGVNDAPESLQQIVFPEGRSHPLDLTALRKEIPESVRLVQFSVFESKTIAWIISKDDFNAVPIRVGIKDLQDLVSNYANTISRPSPSDDPDAKKRSGELYRLLIEPIRPYLHEDEEICLIPSKMLFDVTFGSLTAADGKPLIASFRLLYAPSANVFVLATRNAMARGNGRDESILAVGNPTFSRADFDDLPYLPDSEHEVQNISKLYLHGQTMIRDMATKNRFLKAAPGADVIHFSGHHVVMPGSPMLSYLLLASDGDDPAKSELSNLELSRVSLARTKLIVLAACRSGVETYYRSEGMAGMARTVLAAEVPLVVASQWDVDSEATAALMTRFHELRRNQQTSTTAALRAAQLELITDPTGRFSSPYYWAGFAVYGGSAAY